MPPDDVVFLQTVSGVEYIHSQNLIHGDIKPSNVLISLSNPVQIKVSELTFERKKIGDILNLSETKDMPFWMATESLEQPNSSCEQQDETTATDTFSTGCVLFYFATRGTHPFGNNLIYTAVNIQKNNPVELISLKKSKNFIICYKIKELNYKTLSYHFNLRRSRISRRWSCALWLDWRDATEEGR